MNGALRRFVLVVLPGAFALAIIAVFVAAMWEDGGPDRALAPGPRIGEDHWHAPYTYYVCGEKQPPAPTWEGTGVHTHGDGIIHIHPFTRSEEGAGASLAKWFEYGGGTLESDRVRLPGDAITHRNGDECDGEESVVQVFVNGSKEDEFTRYLPRDGDRIRIVFGPPQDQVTLDDRTIISGDEPDEELVITIEQPDLADESSTFFSPPGLRIGAGETVKLVVTNASTVSHGLRIAGLDAEYWTSDDFVVVPEGADPEEGDGLLEPGQSGYVVIRFDDAPSEPIEFRDPTVISITGEIIVE
jgi:hypothetical protein